MKKSVCIYGCAKNVEQFLPKVFKNISRLDKIFDIKGIFVGYDTSDDDTEKLLLTYAREEAYNLRMCFPDIILKENELVDSFGNKTFVNFFEDQASKERCINISNARNRCLKAIRDSNYNPELIIAMDLDDVCSDELNINVLIDYINRIDEWDGLTFYNERYYDFWALSIAPFTLSCLHNNNNMRIIKAMSNFLKNKHKNSNGLVYCNSAFNGFAIYKYNKYGSLSYSVIHHDVFHSIHDKKQIEGAGRCKYYINNNTDEYNIDCEHRSFHYQATMIHGARLFMATTPLFPPYQGEHCTFLYDF
uniref:Glycosyltransferase n=1 Tax=viral metagenome TaxID=1070528 RepID=A0A6C0LKC4_9ZZZZ